MEVTVAQLESPQEGAIGTAIPEILLLFPRANQNRPREPVSK